MGMATSALAPEWSLASWRVAVGDHVASKGREGAAKAMEEKRAEARAAVFVNSILDGWVWWFVDHLMGFGFGKFDIDDLFCSKYEFEKVRDDRGQYIIDSRLLEDQNILLSLVVCGKTLGLPSSANCSGGPGRADPVDTISGAHYSTASGCPSSCRTKD